MKSPINARTFRDDGPTDNPIVCILSAPVIVIALMYITLKLDIYQGWY